MLDGRKGKSFRVISNGRLSVSSMPTMTKFPMILKRRQEAPYNEAKTKNLLPGKYWPAGVKKLGYCESPKSGRVIEFDREKISASAKSQANSQANTPKGCHVRCSSVLDNVGQ